ncbi:MAG: hypothetical protein KF784_15600 [Fimbriimonadaceae bacterium]|nr:hypothetical protein [Fimbriimonadaceae bacterium]
MSLIVAGLAMMALGGSMMGESIQSLPASQMKASKDDWLLGQGDNVTRVFHDREQNSLILANGLVARRFFTHPTGLGTFSIENLVSQETLVRAVRPEALLTLNGTEYTIGGYSGQPDSGYFLLDWLKLMTPNPSRANSGGFVAASTLPRFEWKAVRLSEGKSWPPKGVHIFLNTELKIKESDTPVRVEVHYEMYDGLPLMSKWVTIRNVTDKPIRLNSFIVEQLAMVEPESQVDHQAEWLKPNVTVLTDYSFGGMATMNSAKCVNWVPDPDYKTQVNYDLKTPCLLEVKPPLGPDVDIQPNSSFDTFRIYELFHDSWDRERKGLAVRKMMRTIAPWCTENPLMLHLTSTDPKVVLPAIDQAAEVGFEMVIFSFGSGLNMEDASPGNIAKFKEFRDYARKKGLDLGGYSLLASRRIDDKNDVINPKTGKPGGAIFGNSPCLESEWGHRYFDDLKAFIRGTGFSILEHDGSYPGDVCASTTHPGHKGLEDSQWTQYQRIKELYEWCRGEGIYLNIPDFYFLVGGSKTGMGYRETNWSLPRAQQHIHCRQNLYDGTWEKTPSMGWMFVPLVQYQGGGAAATIEPLKDHLQDYEMHLANNLGYGAQACYRGPRLYDTPETKAVVVKWVSWFKKYRDILESDVIHVRRADGRNLDCILHANPALERKGMVMVYNPTHEPLTQEITLPLYYTGIENECMIGEQDKSSKKVKLSRDYKITIKPTVPQMSCIWYVVRDAEVAKK